MRVGIIGAGLTGLSAAVELADDDRYDVTVFEAASHIGGIAHVRNVSGRAFHTCGGHCFNTQDTSVLDFLQRNSIDITSGQLLHRDARISFDDGMEIPYPIELNLRAMLKQRPATAVAAMTSLLRQRLLPQGAAVNLRDFFVQTFGKRMAKLYFLPYNTKIWGRDPADLTADWVGGKLPQAPLKDIIAALFTKRADKMIHQHFYYPDYDGGGHYLADALHYRCKGRIELRLATPVEAIQPRERGVAVNGESFDAVISTAPISRLLSIAQGTGIGPEASRLFPVNGLTSVLREGAPEHATWTYLPSPHVRAHRLIHLSNFYAAPHRFSVQEAHGQVDESTMEKDRLPEYIAPRLLDYSYTPNAYPVFIDGTTAARNSVLDRLEVLRIVSAGRFGSHNYVNMDGAIREGMRAAKMVSSWLSA